VSIGPRSQPVCGLAGCYIPPPSPLSGGQRTNLLGALRWWAGQAPVVAGKPGEADWSRGAGVADCSSPWMCARWTGGQV